MPGLLAQTEAASPTHVDLQALSAELRSFCGYRAVWMDREGVLWHAEPDEMLEDLGHDYLGTFFRPSVEQLEKALAAFDPGTSWPTLRAAVRSVSVMSDVALA